VEPGLSLVRVAQSLVFCVVFCTSLFVFFLLAIVLSVLRFTADDYLFGILDLRLMILIWYLRFTAYDYLFGILDLRLMITYLVS
jgi:hypothetical protein